MMSYRLKKFGVTALLIIATALSFYGCFGGQTVVIPDGNYFETKASLLMGSLTKKVGEKRLGKVAVMDIVNADGNVSTLGRYLSFKISESLLNGPLDSMIQRAEILEAIKKLGIKQSSDIKKEDIRKLGKALNVDTFIMGEFVDLEVKIEVNLKLISVSGAEIISAASEEIERTKSVVKLYESF